MTAKFIVKLLTRRDRMAAIEAVNAAQYGDTLKILGPLLTPEQNKKFHATCTDLEKSGLVFAGRARSKADWKVILISGHAVATLEEGDADLIIGIEGEVINLRESTADMSKARGSSLIEYAVAFCAEHAVPKSGRKFSAVSRAVGFLRQGLAA